MQGGLKKLYDLVAPEDTNFSHYKENPTEAEARRKKVGTTWFSSGKDWFMMDFGYTAAEIEQIVKLKINFFIQ